MHRFAMPDLGVAGHDPEILEAHLEYLRRRDYDLISLDDLLRHLDEKRPLRRNAVVFTVDDGYADFAAVGSEIFAKYDCPVTVFLVTGFVSGRLWNWFDRVDWVFRHTERMQLSLDAGPESVSARWTNIAERKLVSVALIETLKKIDDAAKETAIDDLAARLDVQIPFSVPEEYKAMTWSQVRHCANRGATFGPHTASHPILSRVDAGRADREIADSWREVSAQTEATVPVFCYPNGTLEDFSTREAESVQRAGMKAALSTLDGSLQFDGDGFVGRDRFALPRFAYSEDRDRFVQIASGLEERKRRIRSRLTGAPNHAR